MLKRATLGNRGNFFKFYVVVIILQLITEVIDVKTGYSYIMLAMKSTLMPCLIFYVLYSNKGKKLPYHLLFVIIALFFSWLADIFFMLDKNVMVELFLIGLGASLMTHVFYIISFLAGSFSATTKVLREKPEWLLATFLLGFGVIYALNIVRYKFFSEVQIPIILYALTSSIMFYVVLKREKSVSEDSYQFVLIGSFLFIFSACLSAINVFTTVFEEQQIVGRFLIICFYTVGQYMIVEGCLRQEKYTSKIAFKDRRKSILV